ncbi:MAG: NDP-hexose 4-ketoreductase, partial [Planctomycetales bacterium]|nr:NDP-hexose 4-ketoreductase [Planctomycetales bacterium]
MYERFTDRARKTMQLANQEAHRYSHEYIGTEHILLGLIREGSGVAANTLKNLGIDLRKVRIEVEKLVMTGEYDSLPGLLPRTPRSKKVVENSMEEARNLGHRYVATEHLLLGLVRLPEGVAIDILKRLGISPEEVRRQTRRVLQENPVQKPEPSEPEPRRTPESRAGRKTSDGKTPLVDQLATDLTQLAMEGKLDPVVGRETEIERVIQVLSRRRKNNPALIGEPGVG